MSHVGRGTAQGIVLVVPVHGLLAAHAVVLAVGRGRVPTPTAPVPEGVAVARVIVVASRNHANAAAQGPVTEGTRSEVTTNATERALVATGHVLETKTVRRTGIRIVIVTANRNAAALIIRRKSNAIMTTRKRSARMEACPGRLRGAPVPRVPPSRTTWTSLRRRGMI